MLQLAGVGLASTNVVRIIASSDTCGSSAASVSTFVGMSATTSVAASSPHDVYSLSTAGITGGTAGSSYRVCWAHEPAASADYAFAVGTFTLNGPLTQDSVCYLTKACSVQKPT